MDAKVASTPRPHMLDADEVAELLRIKKRQRLRGDQEDKRRAGARARGYPRRVRSDVFDALYFPEVD